MKFMKVSSVVLGVLMIAAGIYCIFNPDITGLAIGYIIGVSMIVDAVGRIHAWFQLKKDGQADGWLLASGILSALFGIVLIVDVAAQLYVDMFIAYIAACWIMVQAIITIVRAFRARTFHKMLDTRYLGKHWWLGFITGILLFAMSVLCFVHPGIVITSMGILIGLGVIVAGANLITLATTPSAPKAQSKYK
ncbi:MAG: DUF308 domain-containing protein [Lachnospiraceae bacterium]|nr:DUF308 domain-containing protein [Lachnospiraceae bacterium]